MKFQSAMKIFLYKLSPSKFASFKSFPKKLLEDESSKQMNKSMKREVRNQATVDASKEADRNSRLAGGGS